MLIPESVDIYAMMGFDPKEFGCVMLNVEPTGIGDRIPPTLLHYDGDKPDWYGIEQEPHITLLYGLLIKTSVIKPFVEQVLYGWFPPKVLAIEEVEVWPEDGEIETLVATIKDPNGILLEAHQRLSRLPHVNIHPTYTPHLTIAYCRLGAAAEAKKYLRMPDTIKTTILNYGKEKE